MRGDGGEDDAGSGVLGAGWSTRPNAASRTSACSDAHASDGPSFGHSFNNPLSLETASRFRPCHCGQSSALTEPTTAAQLSKKIPTLPIRTTRRVFIDLLVFGTVESHPGPGPRDFEPDFASLHKTTSHRFRLQAVIKTHQCIALKIPCRWVCRFSLSDPFRECAPVSTKLPVVNTSI